MSATGRDWEPVLARLTRARHKTKIALDQIESTIVDVCEAESESLILTDVKHARRELDMAVGLLLELTRGQL